MLTQKLSRLLFAEATRVVTLALFVVVFGASAALAQTNQVSFIALTAMAEDSTYRDMLVERLGLKWGVIDGGDGPESEPA